MRKTKYAKEIYGPYTLDFAGRDLLQRFAYCVYREYVDGIPIPKTLDGVPITDHKSKLWWKFFREYSDGHTAYEFTLQDDEWVKPPPDLTRLAGKFSKEV